MVQSRTFSTWVSIAVVLSLAACSGSTTSSTCNKVAACGGNLVGTWKISDSCGSGSVMSMTGGTCTGQTTQIKSFSVSGTLTYNANMTYSWSLVESASAEVFVPSSCLSFGGATATCSQLSMTMASGGTTLSCSTSGSGCNCTVNLNAQSVTQSGTYSVSGNTVTGTTSGATTSSDYCVVQGTTLHVLSTPTMAMGTMGTVMADIVAKKQ